MHVPIKLAAERSGLTPQRIRMWEKRHGVLAASRGPSNRRRFTPAEVEHLNLLRAATEAGHRIGDIAGLSPTALRQLVESPGPSGDATSAPAADDDAIARALRAIIALDEADLRKVIQREHRERGHQGMLQGFVAPLLERVGEAWAAGTLRTMHEHFATATLRSSLLEQARTYAPEANAPTLVATTPAGQLHEMGAVLSAAVARNQGWRVLYLGANLPATEIAAAVRQAGAQLVALSLIHPADDPQLPAELHALREALPDTTALLIGGRAAAGYAATLERIGARTAHSLTELIGLLQAARRGGARGLR